MMSWIVEKRYHLWAVGSFVILSVFGVVLRMMHVFSLPGLDYSFLLHAHSHFAFAAWIFLSLALLLVKQIHPDTCPQAAKVVFIFTLISAFGMLISFSLEGYKAISITFSTLFILVNYFFVAFMSRGGYLRSAFNPTSLKLLKSALFFLVISSIGPFALGPLVAAGFKGGYWYHNAIYFYLHFQMNGWMLFAVLALMANQLLPHNSPVKDVNIWLNLLIGSTLISYFIFTLWGNPSGWFSIIALSGTAINLCSWCVLLFKLRSLRKSLSFLTAVAIVAVSVKTLFQLLVCVPSIGEWVFSERNLIIGYIHLLTLACIMPVILDGFIRAGLFKEGVYVKRLNISYISAVVLYLVMLFFQPLLSQFQIRIPRFEYLLLILSVLLTLIGLAYFISLRRWVPVEIGEARENSDR